MPASGALALLPKAKVVPVVAEYSPVQPEMLLACWAFGSAVPPVGALMVPVVEEDPTAKSARPIALARNVSGPTFIAVVLANCFVATTSVLTPVKLNAKPDRRVVLEVVGMKVYVPAANPVNL